MTATMAPAMKVHAGDERRLPRHVASAPGKSDAREHVSNRESSSPGRSGQMSCTAPIEALPA